MHSASASAHGIRVALEQTANALAKARLDDLLAAAEALEMAIARNERAQPPPSEDAERLRGEVEAARAALLRCRRLGVSLSDFVRATFDAHGAATDYDSARQAAAEMTGRGLNTSV